MEAEPSGRPDDTASTQNALGWDDVLRHKEMTSGHNFHHPDTDSCDGEKSFSEISGDQDVISSVEEECDALESDDETAEDKCLSPSRVCPDLSSVFNLKDLNRENLQPGTSEEMLSFHDRDISAGLSEGTASDSNSVNWCHLDLNQDLHPVIHQPEEQVSLHLPRVDAPQIFFWALSPLLFSVLLPRVCDSLHFSSLAVHVVSFFSLS